MTSSTDASCHTAAPPAASAPATSGAAHTRGADRSNATSTTPAGPASAGVTTPPGCSHHPHSASANTTIATTSAGRTARTMRGARPPSVALGMTSTNASSGLAASERRYQSDVGSTDLEPGERSGKGSGDRTRGQDGPGRHRGQGGDPPPAVPGRGGYLVPNNATIQTRPAPSIVIPTP